MLDKAPGRLEGVDCRSFDGVCGDPLRVRAKIGSLETNGEIAIDIVCSA